jgi:signal transduction histidine kinase
MPVLEDLISIRQPWIDKTLHRMTRGESLMESLRIQLEGFYDRLIQSAESGDPAWIAPILEDWVNSRTISELEAREFSLFSVLDTMQSTAYEVICENLESDSGIALIGTLLPIYTYMFDYAFHKEMDLRIDHIIHNLDQSRDALERLDKSKSDFIAIAAHELKTPLTLIEGYASMVAEQMIHNPEQAVIMLKGINNGTVRLREIIDDMIDVSLIDNNLLALNFQPVWVNRLLNIIVQEVVETISDRRLSMKVASFPGSEEMFFGDPERLYQAFRNLILNAIKFTPDGGSIAIDGRLLPGFIEVTVADTGIGIAPENHTSIFEKFGRLGNVSLHSSGKTKFKGGGPGLGLPITKGIVEAHGGAIWAESDGYDENKCPGTTFHVLLPLRKESPDEKIARLFKTHPDASMEQGSFLEERKPNS